MRYAFPPYAGLDKQILDGTCFVMSTIPKTDSVQKLAEFWDSHDLTDFLDELEEVTEPVFTGRDTVMEIHLSSDEAETVRKIAKFQGIGVTDLIHKWIVEQAYLIQQSRLEDFDPASLPARERNSAP